MLDLCLFYDDIISELGIAPAVMVGESFGGMIALEYAAVFPEHVRTLVCAAPYGLWRSDLPIANYGEYPIEMIPSLFSASPEEAEVRQCFPFDQKGEEFVDRVVNLTWSLGVATKFLWPIPDRGLDRRIHRIQAPTRVLWGTADQIVPSAYAAHFSELLTDVSVELIEGAGHMVFYDAPEIASVATLSFVGAAAERRASTSP